MDVQLGLLFGLVAMASWGISDFLAAYISRKIGFFRAFAITRALSMILLLLLIPFFFTQVALSQTAIILILVTAFFFIVANLSYYKGFAVGEISVISPIASTYPVITVLLSVFLLKESLSLLQIAAIGLAIIGSVLTSFRFADLKNLKPKKFSQGVGYAVLASIGWGIMMLLIGILANTLGWFPPILFMNVAVLFYLIPASRLYKKSLTAPIKGSMTAILLVSILMVIFDTSAGLSYSISTTFSYIAIVATVSSIYPMLTILLARIVFKEKLGANQMLGVGLVLLALFLLSL
jgi:drug/metabolite transporter (DMT)-like permease